MKQSDQGFNDTFTIRLPA